MTIAPARGDGPQARPTPARAVAPGLLAAMALLGALVTVRVLAPESAALPEGGLQDGITLALSVLLESIPFVILGIALAIAVRVYLPTERILARLPRRPAVRRAILSLLGVVLPVCECGNVPMTRGLLMRGLSVPEAMTFLLAAPILNPVTIVVTWQVFGWEDGILLWRIIGGFAIANLVGWLLARHPDPRRMLVPERVAASGHDHGATGHDHGATGHDHGAAGHDHGAPASRLTRAGRMFREESGAVMPALVVGCAIAGAIQVAVPRGVLVDLGQNALLSVLVLMALAFVVSICSNVDAFFILPFAGAFLPGGIVAFLVFGPMIDVKMLALMRTTFTARTLALVTAVVAAACFALGAGVNALA
ncbi:permease [Agromyces marinus]|uniref:Permease n=1 Tax=Agromyces marinus TaxID=1389020 RepID=A0ABN6YFP3_9MICO|nr:permease [Agromyces marinus]UIP60061.1 Putative two-component membrane permease complex subunit SMU_747c [Agromyces marinus]BDZ54826.1 hypothetical protein GCM10025870_18990 [Agromyces marinus]